MNIEPYELEIIKALGTRGPLHPMQLMPLAYPFGIREGGRTAEDMREAKKADYIHTMVKKLVDQEYVFEKDNGTLELRAKGWQTYAANRG